MARKATPHEGPPSPAEHAGKATETRSTATLDLPKLPGPEQLELPAMVKVPAPLRIEAPSIPRIAQEPRLPYAIGVMPKAPFFRWTSPVSGARFVDRVGKLDDKGQYEEKFQGQVVYLTDSQKDATLKQIAQHVVRMIAGSGRIWPVDDHAYRQDPADVPLGGFLFMYPLDPGNPHFRPVEPKPLYREGE